MTNLLIKLFIKNNDNLNNENTRKQYGILGGSVGILCNIALFLMKIIAGVLSSSIAIIADAFNNLSDVASSIVAIIGFKMAAKPPDKKHPFGYGRIEYISSLIISMVIIMMGIEFIKTSIEHIINMDNVKFSITSLIILSVSILLKLWIGLFNNKISKIINSSAIKAMSLDSLVDCIATFTTLVCIIISYYTGLVLDGYAGLIVALFIIYTGYTSLKETLNPLLGEAPKENLINDITSYVLSYEEIKGIHDLIVHNYGPGNLIVTLHAEVPCDSNIVTIHEIIDNIERKLKDELNCNVIIHVDPIIFDNEEVNEIKKLTLNILKNIDERLDMHDFRIVKNEKRFKLVFDIVVPTDFNMKHKDLICKINNEISKVNENYYTLINIDRGFTF